MFGLPEGMRACLFDLDGVLTPTAAVHAAAWKEMFDEFLEGKGPPFDIEADYNDYVDGKPRLDGARSFLESRRIHLPEGSESDPPGAPTVHGLANRKNELVLAKIRAGGVSAYPGSVRFVEAVRDGGLARAVVSSSANCHDVLVSAGIAELFDARIDGIVADEQHLAGKPAPDTFLAGARALGVPPAQAVVFEDALAGVAAGKAGAFGFVVGVDRLGDGHAQALLAHGADTVVSDLAELLDRP